MTVIGHHEDNNTGKSILFRTKWETAYNMDVFTHSTTISKWKSLVWFWLPLDFFLTCFFQSSFDIWNLCRFFLLCFLTTDCFFSCLFPLSRRHIWEQKCSSSNTITTLKPIESRTALQIIMGFEIPRFWIVVSRNLGGALSYPKWGWFWISQNNRL